jgi:DNA-binding SARP family transcriptional activator/TolB-like protein
MIKLRTLGGVELTDSRGSELRSLLAQPKRLALLVYLASRNHHATRRRDSLVALFWPELDSAHARGALRQALRFLRRELGENVLNGQSEEAVGFDPGSFECDAVAFEQACDGGRLTEGLELYRGDFLEGFFVSGGSLELERWIESERARLRKCARDAARALAERADAAGDRLAAARWAQRALALAPDDEDALRCALRLLDRAGDRAGALRVYADFTALLAREFGVAPSAETRQLWADVRSREDRVPGRSVPLPPERAAVATGESPRDRPTFRRLRWLSVLVGGALAMAALVILRRSSSPPADPATSVIAVLPFESSVPDSALTRLGRDLATTVSATLDGLGDLRTVDRLAILARTQGLHAPLTLDDAMALGRRFGATRVVRGTLVPLPSGVRVDFGVYSTDSGTPILAATVVATPDITILTDSIAWAILRSVWRRGNAPTPSLASVTTHSVPAFSAFLDGERAVEEFDWSAAATGYERAIALDSTFWLAYHRYVEARYWLEASVDSSVLERLSQHRRALPERDRLLVDAWLTPPDTFTLMLRTLQDLTRRFPDYSPGWFAYSDALVHFGPMLGYTSADARRALRTTLALRPRLIPAWQHLAMLSAGQDTQAFRESAGHLIWSRWRSEPWPDPWRFSTWHRLVARVGRTAGRLDRLSLALVDSVVRSVGDPPGDWRADFAEVGLYAGFPALQSELNGRMLTRDLPPSVAANYRRCLALSWAARGAWDSALAEMDRYARADPAMDGGLDAYALATLGAWLGAIDAGEATKRRAAAARAVLAVPAVGALEGNTEARLTWLDGIVAFSRHDRHALAAALKAMRRAGPSDAAAFNQRSLAAFEIALLGNRRRAGEALAELERYSANRPRYLLDNYEIAIHRLAAARWLLDAGDSAQGARLLTWHQAAHKGPFWAGTEVTAGLAYLEMAKLEDARGDPGLAAEYYRQFLRRYDRPMPAQQHIVHQAEVALTRLQRRN